MPPRGSTMTRSAATVPKTAAINTNNVLFQYGNWIGLKASNQWGFDILNLGGQGYHQSVIQSKDFNALMQCFQLYLQQSGKLTGAATGVATRSVGRPRASGSATNNVAQPIAASQNVTRGRNVTTRGSRAVSRRTRTPALATSSTTGGINSSSPG